MNQEFKFIDLFAGIGGFHIAMHNLGGKCVFASEMDVHARKTYEHNFKKTSPGTISKNITSTISNRSLEALSKASPEVM